MNPFKKLNGKIAVINHINIDTDQIIPAQFLKTIESSGLGKFVFHSWRYLSATTENPNFFMNQAASKDANVLVVGDNFGCGSSREHASWSLLDAGFRVVISTRIADIFKQNALKNGFLPIELSESDITPLLNAHTEAITVDLENNLIVFKGTKIPFKIDGFSRVCMLKGVDELDYLLSFSDQIKTYEIAQAKEYYGN
jgi:3-isopropylmalate/(R)-2-methylmalate dehydratase small subunit